MATLQSTLFSLKNSEPTNNISMVLNTDGTTWMGIGTNTPTSPLDVHGVTTHAVTVPLTAAVSQDFNVFTTQMPTLAAQFGASNSDTFRSYAFNLESDTSASGYGGIMNALIARVDMVTVAATWSKVEAIAGVINTKSSMTSGTVTDGYGTAGEILHAGGSTITTIRGLSGNVQITAAGTIGTAYGTDSVITTTLGQTGTVTVKAAGSRSYVQINNTNAMQWAIGAENYVDLVAATTVTTDVYGSFNYIQNTTTATVTGNTYGSYDKVTITGAMVTTGTLFGTFSNIVINGTALGGSTNAALNAEAQWASSSNPTGAVYAIQARARNSGASAVVANLEAIHILAPVFANSGTATAARGIRIANPGSASATTAEGLRIDAVSGSATNRAIITQGGLHVWVITAGNTIAWQISDGTTNVYTLNTSTSAVTMATHSFVGPTVAIASAAGNSYSVVNIPAYTYNTTGTATVTALNGVMLNVAQPTVSSAGASATTTSSSVYIAGPPINAGSGSLTTVYSLHVAAGNIGTAGLITLYNGIATNGNGVPSEVKVTRPSQQANATVTLATYTCPASDGSYEIQANVNVTVSTTVTMTVTCSYTDEANVARVLTLPFFLLAGTLVQSITTAQGNIAYSSMPITIRAKASTSITIATAGTVTAVTYTGEGIIKQLA